MYIMLFLILISIWLPFSFTYKTIYLSIQCYGVLWLFWSLHLPLINSCHSSFIHSYFQVIHDAPRWSWCSTVWSIITCCCCFSPLGFLALLLSIFSYTDHKSGDYSRASYKRRCSWGCAMTGIAVGVLLLVSVILLFIVYMPETATQLCKWGYSEYCGVQCRYLSCWKIWSNDRII